MKKHLYILTGASRGMGLAMAQQLLSPDHFVLGISRQTNDALEASAKTSGSSLEQWPLDLDHTVEAAAMLAQWLGSRKPDGVASATLINNAAMLPTIGPLSQADSGELAKVMRVGLEAPMQLTAAFLHTTEKWADSGRQAIPRRVLNISSGNGRRAMASQSIYSATKAGMDHFSRCVALEEALKPQGARVCSLAPGVIDTDMQTHLRQSDANAFPDHGRFVDLKMQGHLTSAEDAARKILAFLARADFGDNPVADIREVA
jgi:NAD(P)-dependent dehydrogenase (short-subunit alcohol dehydrogenase family)